MPSRRNVERKSSPWRRSMYAARRAGIRVTTDDKRCRHAAHFTHKQTAGAHMQKASFLKDEVREMFDRIDEDGDRSINFEEFAGLMLEMDHAKLNSELRACFDFIDTDHDGRVSFDEFCQWVSR